MAKPRRGPTPLMRKHKHFLCKLEHDPSLLVRAGPSQLRAAQEVLQNIKMGFLPIPPNLIKGVERPVIGHALETACDPRTRPQRLKALLRGNRQTGGFPLQLILCCGVQKVTRKAFP